MKLSARETFAKTLKKVTTDLNLEELVEKDRKIKKLEELLSDYKKNGKAVANANPPIVPSTSPIHPSLLHQAPKSPQTGKDTNISPKLIPKSPKALENLKRFEINPSILAGSFKGSPRNEYHIETLAGAQSPTSRIQAPKSGAADTTKIRLEGEIVSLRIKIEFLEKENSKLKISR